MKYTGYVETTGTVAEKLKFVSAANNKKDWRRYAESVLVEETESGFLAVATDGKRIHTVALDKNVFDVFGVSAGLYTPIKSKKRFFSMARISNEDEKEIKFPLWKSVLPKGKPEKEITFYPPLTGYGQMASYIDSLRAMPDWLYISPVFLSALTVCDRWDCKIYGKDKVVEFVSPDTNAYIMPLISDSCGAAHD
jgi:hypothetical protein